MYELDYDFALKKVEEEGIYSAKLLDPLEVDKWENLIRNELVLRPVHGTDGEEVHVHVSGLELGNLMITVSGKLQRVRSLNPFNHAMVHKLWRHNWEIPRQENDYFTDLIVYIVIKGKGYFNCQLTDDSPTKFVRASAGDIIIMHAPGFCKKDFRPKHYGTCISKTMTLICFRRDKRKK